MFRVSAIFSLALVMCVTGCQDSGVKEKEPVAEQQEVEAPPEKRPNLLKRKTTEVVDKNKAMAENPNLIEVENKLTGSDPLTTSLTGYIAASSKINVMAMQHQVDLMQAMNDRYPTHEEFMEVVRSNNMEFNALPDYQMYAYDDQAGVMLVLEDPVAKEEFYEQAK